MASAIDICNLSLSHLGESPDIASIDPPEGSSYAKHCCHDKDNMIDDGGEDE